MPSLSVQQRRLLCPFGHRPDRRAHAAQAATTARAATTDTTTGPPRLWQKRAEVLGHIDLSILGGILLEETCYYRINVLQLTHERS